MIFVAEFSSILRSEEPPLPKELIEGIEALNNAILVDKNQLAKEKKKTTPQAANLRRKRQLEESSATNVHSASPMKSMLINSKSPLKKKVRFEAEAESSALPKSTPTEINESKAELEADGIAKGKGKKPAAMAKTKIINKSLALETSQRRTNNSLSTELVELPTPSRKSRRLSAAKAPLYKAKDADGSASQSAQSPSLNSELEASSS